MFLQKRKNPQENTSLLLPPENAGYGLSAVVMSRAFFVCAVILLVLIADQWLKIWVKTHMYYGQSISLMGADWAFLYFVENPGMAFGYTFGGGEYAKLLLSLLRLLAIGLLLYYLVLLIRAGASRWSLLSFSLILAGAAGNVIDSAFYGLIFSASPFHTSEVAHFTRFGQGYADFLYGKVVDMFYFPIKEGAYPEWLPYFGGKPYTFFKPVFNIADVAITVGVISAILMRNELHQLTSAEEAQEETEQEGGKPIVSARESEDGQTAM
jgi:signal peptidase II